MLRQYAAERAQGLHRKLIYRGYDLELRRAPSGWRVGFIPAQPIFRSLVTVRSLLSTNTRQW
jgi:hypothetical protein